MAEITATPKIQAESNRNRTTRANSTGMRQQLFSPSHLDTFLRSVRKATKVFSPSADDATERQQQQQLQKQQQQQQQQQGETQQQPMNLDFIRKGLSTLYDRFKDHTESSETENLRLVAKINVLEQSIVELEGANQRQNCRINELIDRLDKYEKELPKQLQQQKGVPTKVQTTTKGKGSTAVKKSSNAAPEPSTSFSRAPAASGAGASSSAPSDSCAPASGVLSASGAGASDPPVSAAVPVAPPASGASAPSVTVAAATNGATILNGVTPPPPRASASSELPTLNGAVKWDHLFIGNLGPNEGKEELKEVIYHHTNIPKVDIKIRELPKSSSGSRAYQVSIPEGGANKMREKRNAMFKPNSSIKLEKWGINKARNPNTNYFRGPQHNRGHGSRPRYHNGPRRQRPW